MCRLFENCIVTPRSNLLGLCGGVSNIHKYRSFWCLSFYLFKRVNKVIFIIIILPTVSLCLCVLHLSGLDVYKSSSWRSSSGNRQGCKYYEYFMSNKTNDAVKSEFDARDLTLGVTQFVKMTTLLFEISLYL